MKPIKTKPPACEIFILAGGLSSRMGRDKSRVRIGKQTMLQHVRAAAAQVGVPVRIIRRDSVPRCGPLGGIYTALKRSHADTILFLACDMPFVSSIYLKKMFKAFQVKPKSVNNRPSAPALFTKEDRRAGFPCLLRREIALPVVARQIDQASFSLQSLAKMLQAGIMKSPRQAARQLANINTPADLKKAAMSLVKA